MKYLPLSLLLIPLLAFSADEPDYNISIRAQGTLGYNKNFESIGSGKIYSAETILEPHGGYAALYRKFKQEEPNQITSGVWQKAEAFNEFLQKCNIQIPTESLAIKMGFDAVFASKSQGEIDTIAEELGQHLSFERKITFISSIGNALGGVWDSNRDSAGVVSMMTMVEARQKGIKAGVCRDMHQAMASMLVKMGVPHSFVVATQVLGGGHAVTLAQDPNDPSKSYMINYGYTSSQQSANSSAHLLLDTTIPSVGVQYRIYDANGKPVANLPSGLGSILSDFVGMDQTFLDPLARSENSFASVMLKKGDRASFSTSYGLSSDNDKVLGVTARYKSEDEHFPNDVSLTLYNAQRETNLNGKLSTNGAYMQGIQYLKFKPISGKEVAEGKMDVEVYGRLEMKLNMSLSSLESKSKKNQMGMDLSYGAAAGTKVEYGSNDGKTKVSATIEARGRVDKADVRDEESIVFDLRDVAGTVAIERQISKGLDGYAKGTVVARPGLGVQSRQEIGVKIVDSSGHEEALTLGREGQVAGPVLAFVPGSLKKYTAEISYSDSKKNSVSGGVFCSTSGKTSCGSRVTGKITLPLGWDKF